MKPLETHASYIYGKQPVLEALKGASEIEKIWVQAGTRNETLTEITTLAREKGVGVQQVPAEKLQYLTRTPHHQGVAAYIARIHYHDYTEVIDDLLHAGEKPFILLLDGVTDVRNLGAIARTAYGMGVHAIILPLKGAAPVNSETIKSSAGAIQHLKVCRVPHLLDVVRYLQQYNIPCIALEGKGAVAAVDADLELPLAVIVGDEHRGIDRRLLQETSKVVRLPIQHALDSYNVSVATAMLLYEITRKQQG